MDKPAQNKPQESMEKVVSFFLTLHFLSMLVLSIVWKWSSWIPFYMGTCIVFVWGLQLGKFKTVFHRTAVTSVLINIALFLYSFYSKDMITVTVPFAAVTVLLALLGYIFPLFISLLTELCITVTQVFFVRSIDWQDGKSISDNLFVFLNAAFICLILYVWNRMRAINQMHMQDNVREMFKAQKAKDDFLANVSHEIRTPVNTISGLGDILINEKDPTKLKEDLNRIRVAGRSLMFVVTDILDFSELQHGEIVLAEENYNISSTINDLVNMSIAQKGEKPIELLVNYEANLPRGLIGDEKRIRRALMNVIGNAFKFSEHGCVVLDITHRKEDYGVNLVFSVRDTGIGMKPEELEKLFSTYNQVDAGRTRAEGGIGLGLAITRAIVQKMGGTISVFSNYEKGTEIRIVVPQEVVDSRPIITIKNPEKVNVCIYFNLEQFMAETRDEYYRSVQLMQEQLNTTAVMCKNLAEVKRRQSENSFTHMFISLSEYKEDTVFFDALAKKIKVVAVLDNNQSDMIENPEIYKIYKPFQLMPIAQAINNEITVDAMENVNKKEGHFVAPDVRVLIVDDNDMNIRVAGGLLRRYKIEYEPALSGAEALEKIESQDYDFVFMDHMMPEMDGVECLHRLRQKSGRFFKEVPVVALTANAVAGAREMLLGEGFDDFVEKPIEISVLERMLRRILPEEKLQFSLDESVASDFVEIAEGAGEKAAERVMSGDGNFTYDSLNKENGYLYCGGEESFEEIIGIYAEKGETNYLPLKEVFDKEDWANYTIMIHAVKSSMKSIGADFLSEQARLLEMAGKEDRIAYIKENHEMVYEMYKTLIHDFMKRAGKELPSEGQTASAALDLSGIEEIASEELEELKKSLEDAMFELDGDKMLLVLEKAKGKRYGDVILDKVVAQVEQKIKMSDFMSAFDTFAKL